MRKAGDNPAAQARAMATVAKTYQGTYYGQLAANDGVDPHPFHRFVENPLKLLPEAEQKKSGRPAAASYEELLKKLPGIDLHPYESKRFLIFSDLSDGLVRTPSSPNWTECTTSFASCTGSSGPAHLEREDRHLRLRYRGGVSEIRVESPRM